MSKLFYREILIYIENISLRIVLEDVGITTETTETVENRSTGQVEESKTATAGTPESDVLQQLVTEAVKKVLANQTVTDVENKFSCQNVVSQVVEGLKPTLTSGSSSTVNNVTTNTVEESTNTPAPVNMQPCVYNPTPIAELKKRHIPIVSYMPTRKSTVAVKRKSSPDGVKPWLNIGNESADSQSVEIKYKPSVIITPEARDTMQSYIPTCRSESTSLNSCKDGSSSEYLFKLRETYYPKTKKKREEYVPKKVKTPLKTADGLNESTLDNFGTNPNMIDEVLIHSKSTSDVQSNKLSQDSAMDIEPKFSDDEEEDSKDHDNNDVHDDISKINTDIEFRTLEQNKSYSNVKRSDCLNNIQGVHFSKTIDSNEYINKENHNEKILTHSNTLKQEMFPSEEDSKSLQCKERNVSEIESNKSTVESVKEYKNKDKSKDKNHSTSHKKYKDKHESSKKSHSSYSKSKSKNHLRHRSKESKDKKRDRDRSRYKHREEDRDKERDKSKHKSKSDRKDNYRSEKRHKYSKSSSKEHSKNKSDRNDKHSKSSRRSDEKYAESKEKKTSNSLKSVQLNSMDDGDEEYNDHYNSINDNVDVTFSTSDSDHDVQEECLKIFQVCIVN